MEKNIEGILQGPQGNCRIFVRGDAFFSSFFCIFKLFFVNLQQKYIYFNISCYEDCKDFISCCPADAGNS